MATSRASARCNGKGRKYRVVPLTSATEAVLKVWLAERADALFARRMDAVRIFARHRPALDPATQIPPEAIGNRRYRPKDPNVFSEAEVLALLATADTLSPRFKALTWRTLIGLLAATGMRPGEACHLTVSDIDLTNGVIQVLETKFDKSRLAFIHPTTATVLGHYLQVRQDWVGPSARARPAVFVNSRREAINPDTLGDAGPRPACAAHTAANRSRHDSWA